METAILTGIGLAAPAGLNAYIPLLALALADRATTLVTLHAPYDALSSNTGIAILILLLTIEVTVDKIPGVDHVNDIIQSFVRPAAGAIVALASTTGIVAINPAVTVTEVEEVLVGPAQAAAGRATDWGAIIGGALAAMGVTIILFTAGSGFGLSTVEPWSFANRAPETFAIGAAIWLIVMQWVSSAVGGYLAGRLRVRWHHLHGDESFFRDTAHGLITWAMATVIVAGVAVLMTTLAGLAASDLAEVAPASPAAADEARKAVTAIALFTGFSMLIGAFIASVSAVLGGRLRDRHP